MTYIYLRKVDYAFILFRNHRLFISSPIINAFFHTRQRSAQTPKKRFFIGVSSFLGFLVTLIDTLLKQAERRQ
jgi:hypothetical protein